MTVETTIPCELCEEGVTRMVGIEEYERGGLRAICSPCLYAAMAVRSSEEVEWARVAIVERPHLPPTPVLSTNLADPFGGECWHRDRFIASTTRVGQRKGKLQPWRVSLPDPSDLASATIEPAEELSVSKTPKRPQERGVEGFEVTEDMLGSGFVRASLESFSKRLEPADD